VVARPHTPQHHRLRCPERRRRGLQHALAADCCSPAARLYQAASAAVRMALWQRKLLPWASTQVIKYPTGVLQRSSARLGNCGRQPGAIALLRNRSPQHAANTSMAHHSHVKASSVARSHSVYLWVCRTLWTASAQESGSSEAEVFALAGLGVCCSVALSYRLQAPKKVSDRTPTT
jgi:hypothetical protein